MNKHIIMGTIAIALVILSVVLGLKIHRINKAYSEKQVELAAWDKTINTTKGVVRNIQDLVESTTDEARETIRRCM